MHSPKSGNVILKSTNEINYLLIDPLILDRGWYMYIICKGQIISECPYEIIVYPKIATKKISEISALAYKERSNQKPY